jgi:hypothetical protein
MATCVLPLGDVSIRASVVQTSALPQSVARHTTSSVRRTLLLLVARAQRATGQRVAIPVRVTARVTDLRATSTDRHARGARRRSIDSAGMVRTSLPETLPLRSFSAIAGQRP